MSKSALIIVDVQYDFLPGGALEVKKSDQILPVINSIIENYHSKFNSIIATQDWHPENHISFAKTHSKNVYETININGLTQILWPVHCVAGSKGAEISEELSQKYINLIVRKGTNPELDSYSAFFENDKKTSTGLAGYLKELGITKVFICGLAFDFCVFYTADDALTIGFDTIVIEDATKAVNIPEGTKEKVKKEMVEKGIIVINSSDISNFM